MLDRYYKSYPSFYYASEKWNYILEQIGTYSGLWDTIHDTFIAVLLPESFIIDINYKKTHNSK